MSSSLEKLYGLSKDLNVLYVEDDLSLQRKTFSMFSNIFNKVDTANDGKEGFVKYNDYFEQNGEHYDMVVTDIKMPLMDGVSLSKKIKKLNNEQVIIVTSAHDESKFLIEFINMGVNKFIKKPFKLDVITTIFHDVCNEHFGDETAQNIELGESFFWDKGNKKLFNDTKEIKLSYSEIVILDLMLSNPDQIFSNSDFYYTIQSHSFDQELSNDSIKSAIKRLRKKIPEGTIENIYGQGYRIKKTI